MMFYHQLTRLIHRLSYVRLTIFPLRFSFVIPSLNLGICFHGDPKYCFRLVFLSLFVAHPRQTPIFFGETHIAL